MRKLVICNYFEGILAKNHCPYCGLSNCEEHINLKDYVDYEDLTAEERAEVARLLKLVDGKNWSITIEHCEGSGFSFGAYLKYVVEEEWGKTVYIEICEELDEEDEIGEDHTCANPNCTCEGKCKVCKCETENKIPSLEETYILEDGMWWDKLTNIEKDQISLLLQQCKVQEKSHIRLQTYSEYNRLVPTLMIIVVETMEVINSGITLESLSDRKL